MTPQELKTSILKLAFQGKLVEQRLEEDSAENLIQTIKNQKSAEQLKKEQILRQIDENELPFEIPSKWVWVHFNEIAVTSLGKTLDKLKNTGTMQPYLCSINVYWNGIDLSKVKKAKFEDEEKEKYLLKKGDLLICEGGDVGRSAIWNSDEEMYYQNALHRVRFHNGIMPEFYKYLLECYKGMGIIDRYSKGVTIKHLVQHTLYSMWLPLPPLGEQKRIVDKIVELLPYIDRYEKAWSKLEDLNKRFPIDMQKSILQMAIQGKLVEQRPEDGTGEELYQKILAEKQKLIKDGKIKKEKPLPEVFEDEIPFEIPANWKWVRVSELFSVLNGDRGKNYPAKSTLSHKGIPFISALNLNGKTVVEDDNLLCMSEQQYERLGNGKLIQGDIVVCIRGSLGKHGKYPFNRGAIASSLVILRPFLDNEIISDFLMIYLDTSLFFSEIRKYDNGTAQPNLAAKCLQQFLFPLPPLAEQKRIIDKLEEISPLCEKLE